jgi:hypothetical protein
MLRWYYDKGRDHLGRCHVHVGPFVTDQTYSLYGDQSAAVLALKAGEVDYLYNRWACSVVCSTRSRVTRT